MAKSTVKAEAARIRVDALSTSNLTLSGTQTIDDIAVGVGDLVGAMNQSNGKNGVYVVQSGAWLAADPGFGTGLEVYASAGTANKNKVYGCDTVGAIDWGTTSTTFTLKSSSGAAFDPASPGAIGGTTPAAGTFTTLSAATVAASTELRLTNSGGASPTSGAVKLFGHELGLGLTVLAGSGDAISERYIGDSGSGNVERRVFTKSLADDASLDITLTASSEGDWGRLMAPGPTGSVGGFFTFAANAATTLNGVAYTSIAAADTDTNLCVFASGGALRVRNRLGSTQTVMVEICEVITP